MGPFEWMLACLHSGGAREGEGQTAERERGFQPVVQRRTPSSKVPESSGGVSD